ncbi:MAG: DNA-directed RNA polymerase subunit omega [Nitrospinota bacterium]
MDGALTLGDVAVSASMEQSVGRELLFMADQALLTKALERVQNRFLLTNILAKRIMQLRKGSDPLIETDEEDFETIALKEIIEGKLEWRVAVGATASDEIQAPLEESEEG